MLRLIFLLTTLTLLNGINGRLIPVPVNPRVRNDYNVALEAIFSMGIRLQALLYNPALENKHDNFLISPISATTLIAELMLAADDDMAKELHDLLSLSQFDKEMFKNTTHIFPYNKLHLQLSGLLQELNSNNTKRHFTLESPSVIFYDKNMSLCEDFLKKLQLYETYTFPLDFSKNVLETQMFMNAWANKSTHGLIKEFLPHPPSVNTAAIFGNILYFKAEWEVPFSYQLNRKGLFSIDKKKTVNVTYMLGEMENLLYAESEELKCKMIALPYKNKELSLYIILPTDDIYDIKDFVQNIKTKDILKLEKKLEEHQVSLKLPKISLTSTSELLEPLKKYSSFKKNQPQQNMTIDLRILDSIEHKIDSYASYNVTKDVDIFLTHATKSRRPLKVSNIVQQVKFLIDEKGTEAAAITAGTVDYIGVIRNFYVDRPFSFFIRHEETTAVLFWGTIVDPSKSS